MNRKEYNHTVDRCADNLYRFILKSCRSRELAEDVVQDSFLRLWEMLSVITPEKAKSFLFKVAYNRMIDLLRREKKYGENDSLEVRETPASAFNDLPDILETALARLPQVQQTVVLLRDYEDYSYREIGEIVGLSEAQVKVYIFRARSQMKSYLRSPDLVI